MKVIAKITWTLLYYLNNMCTISQYKLSPLDAIYAVESAVKSELMSSSILREESRSSLSLSVSYAG